jgi:3-methylfumaryl-CoA hydratase
MIDIASLKPWIGRQKIVGDTLAPFAAAALTATLDRDDAPRAGEPLPPLWHWIYFHDPRRGSELADNGHARLGRFMPPIPLPRRMYAGGRITVHRPLLIGRPARRISTIADVQVKAGRSGPLAFLTVRHEFADAEGTAVVDEQDLVYREATSAAGTGEARRAPGKAPWRRAIETDEALLFRYSALIFNAHRIHYDLPYCEKEGYPGLVVHGPLIATLLADLVRRNTDRAVTAFSFRAVKPLFHPAPWAVCGIPKGNTVELWAEDGEGAVAMEARATLSGPG